MSSVLVIGSGGREHVIAWKLSLSPKVSRVIVAPGNAGMPAQFERWAFSGNKNEFEALAKRAQGEKVSLVVVGPDDPLSQGIVNVFSSYGILTFGPSQAAAQIESSKAFAKEVMLKAQVPTASFEIFDSLNKAEQFLRQAQWPPQEGFGWVVKADGLALGKGVQVCATYEAGLQAVRELFKISGRLVIEECLRGEEVSWMAFSDGERVALLEPARDHKTLYEGNQGPNTGGMGAYSPVPGYSDTLSERVRNEVFLPTIQEMKKRGTPFRGVLYAGLMVSSDQSQFWVLEFNARFGDPEAQALLLRMQDDLYTWCERVACGDIRSLPQEVSFSKDFAVVVVAAAPGYPDKVEKGIPLVQLMANSDSKSTPPPYFTAGVSHQAGGDWVNSGGRVFCANGMGEDLQTARHQAYDRLNQARFPGMQFRKDIAR